MDAVRAAAAPGPTLRPEDDYLQTAWRESVYPLAARYGVEIRLPTVSPQPYTRLAFEGLEFAKDYGKADAYNTAVMRAFFQRSENIGEPEVLADIAGSAGLDRHAFLDALRDAAFSARTAELLRHARYEMRVRGVPLFVIGDARLSGVQPREALEAYLSR